MFCVIECRNGLRAIVVVVVVGNQRYNNAIGMRARARSLPRITWARFRCLDCYNLAV